MHEALERFWAATSRALAPPPGREWQLQFATAALEIANNIARHAYPGGGEPGPLALRLRAYPDRIEARFTDRGVAYTPPAAAPLAPLGDDLDVLDIPEGGYGLALVRAAVDRLDHRRTPGGLNRWRLVKRLAG